MPQFNFLSGSSVDNFNNFIFDALQSGEAYLGFSRGVPEMQWGINALVYIEHKEYDGVSTFPEDSVATVGDDSSSDKFFDLNSLSVISGSNDINRDVYIGRALNSDINLDNIDYFDSSEIGSLKLSFLGKNWAIIEGLSRYYYNIMNVSDSASYYILNYNKNKAIPLKILNKSFTNIPSYTSTCNLFMKKNGESNYSLIKTGIQRNINILGETFVSGMNAPETILETDIDVIFSESISGTQNKTDLLNASFVLKDDSGAVLIENMTFVDPESGNNSSLYTEISSVSSSSKFLTFKYSFIDSDLQYIKFIVGSNQNNELGIWNEVLPYDSAIPTSDSNPPGLDVSYLKNPLISSSIFDVKGIIQIDPSEVEFIKEMFNDSEVTKYQDLGFEIETIDLSGPNSEHTGIVRFLTQAGSATTLIPLNDFHTFIVGDSFNDPIVSDLVYNIIAVDYTFGNATIEIDKSLVSNLDKNFIIKSNTSNLIARVTLAKTKNKEKALKHGLSSVMISKVVDLVGSNSPTEEIYRQLFISYKPKNNNDEYCTNFIHQDLFDINSFEYRLGSILYISNKIPVYRKWANINEEFRIII